MYVRLWMIGWWRMVVIKDIIVAGMIASFELVVVYRMGFPFTKLWTYKIIFIVNPEYTDWSKIRYSLFFHNIKFYVYLLRKLVHNVLLCCLLTLIPQWHKIILKDGVKCNVCKCPPMNPDCFLAKQLYMLYYSAYWNVESTCEENL